MADEGWRGSPTPAIDLRHSAKASASLPFVRGRCRGAGRTSRRCSPECLGHTKSRIALLSASSRVRAKAWSCGARSPRTHRDRRETSRFSSHTHRNRGPAPRDWSGSRFATVLSMGMNGVIRRVSVTHTITIRAKGHRQRTGTSARGAGGAQSSWSSLSMASTCSAVR